MNNDRYGYHQEYVGWTENMTDERVMNDVPYVAQYDGEKASTGLQFIEKGHPFYDLEGKDNIVLFYTDRYTEQPLVIKGAGAGAEVTASGIFADVLRYSNK